VEERRVAVVTGASPGTGGAAARQLAAAGYRVFGASRTAPGHGPPDLSREDGLDPACIAALRSRPRPRGPGMIVRVVAVLLAASAGVGWV
jgi:NAD(P)-dependent dehydrogenase (short-subunit alcohol dehydrogenase family)